MDFQARKVNKEKGDLTVAEVPKDTQECLVTKVSVKLNTCITETFIWNMTRIRSETEKKINVDGRYYKKNVPYAY